MTITLTLTDADGGTELIAVPTCRPGLSTAAKRERPAVATGELAVLVERNYAGNHDPAAR